MAILRLSKKNFAMPFKVMNYRQQYSKMVELNSNSVIKENNDPRSRPIVPPQQQSHEVRFIVLFCDIWKSGHERPDVQTLDVKIVISTGRVGRPRGSMNGQFLISSHIIERTGRRDDFFDTLQQRKEKIRMAESLYSISIN